MRREASREVLVPDESLSINQGGIRWFRNMIGSKNIEWQEFAYLCKQYKIDLDKPIKDFTEREKEIIFNGSDKEFKYEITSVNGNVMHRQGFIEGIQKRIHR